MAEEGDHNALADRATSTVVFEGVIFSLMFATALAGNILVCLAFINNSTLRRSLNNYFIVSLAVSDILMAVLVEPLTFSALVTGKWPFSDAACQYHGVAMFILGVVSLQTFMLISVNRYVKMVKSNILYKKVFKKNTVLLMIIISWIIASISLPIFLLTGNRFAFNSNRSICYPVSSLTGRVFLHSTYALFIMIPHCIMFFCYFKVFRKIHDHNAQIANSAASGNSEIASQSYAREVRVTRMLFVTMVAFHLCWIPLYALELAVLIRNDLDAPRAVYITTTFTVSASSSINPIIYAVMTKDFRDTFKRILFCTY